MRREFTVTEPDLEALGGNRVEDGHGMRVLHPEDLCQVIHLNVRCRPPVKFGTVLSLKRGWRLERQLEETRRFRLGDIGDSEIAGGPQKRGRSPKRDCQQGQRDAVPMESASIAMSRRWQVRSS